VDVLVTGSCGYIGSALVPLLQADERVDGVSVLDDCSTGSPRRLVDARVGELDFHDGDVREYGDVERALGGADAVIHLAAITGADSTHDRREATYRTNREGTENVLTAAGERGVERVVLASSCNVYGRAGGTGVDESVAPDPLNPYAETKLESEKLLAEHAERYGTDGTALRLSTVYGDAPGIRFNLVVNAFVFRALTGRPLTVYGDGSNWRPFIHARDAARAFREAALDPASWSAPVYNVGANEENYRIREVAEVVSEVVEPVDITYLADERPGPSYHVSFDRLAGTGFELDYGLREGVHELAARFEGDRGDGGVKTVGNGGEDRKMNPGVER
jgi:nucleoside-diphosphate-sugar epimerase